MLDETHERTRRSWVSSANGHPSFAIQNLPFGVFSPAGGGRRLGVAIGDSILDIKHCADLKLFGAEMDSFVCSIAGDTLNAWMAARPSDRRALRRRISGVLQAGAQEEAAIVRSGALHDSAHCALHLPARIGGYTDFFAGIHHAVAAGRLLRPNSPLHPNYKYVPIGYNGRASTVTVSGGSVRRPRGQHVAEADDTPKLGPSRQLDYELEAAVWIGAGNAHGETIPIGAAHESIAGFGLLNDWSARDLQRWEAQPLGPFLAKSFHTTVTPWVITVEALEPFRAPQPRRPEGDPAPLPHLLDAEDQACGAFSVKLEAFLITPRMRAESLQPQRLSVSSMLDLYWTPAQLVAHHASNGCKLDAGDLFGTGTVSGPDARGSACLLELTEGGRRPVTLPNGETRSYLEDGDEVLLRATCERDGFASIGFGDNRGVVVANSERNAG